jgi:hypothetical protein
MLKVALSSEEPKERLAFLDKFKSMLVADGIDVGSLKFTNDEADDPFSSRSELRRANEDVNRYRSAVKDATARIRVALAAEKPEKQRRNYDKRRMLEFLLAAGPSGLSLGELRQMGDWDQANQLASFTRRKDELIKEKVVFLKNHRNLVHESFK